MDNTKAIRLAILLTCYNRKEKTVQCLSTLLKTIPVNIDVELYLVDDGCTDGTSDAVKAIFPNTNILTGNGALFWNMGMRFAFSEAIKQEYSYYLWINDDVIFENNIIAKLLDSIRIASNPNNTILVGYTTDASKEKITYGGYIRKKNFIPLELEMVKPGKKLKRCDTFNGNCVLIPESVVHLIGINSDKYRHGFGDIDYGFRASEQGVECLLTNYSVGVCEKNTNAQIWNDLYYKAPIVKKYKAMTSIRCRPNKEWKYFTKRFGGKRWILRFCAPYVKLFVSAFVSRFCSMKERKVK